MLQNIVAPTVADQIIQVINDLCAKFGIAFDWSVDNVWPYLQELGRKLVLYKMGIAIMWMCIAVVFIVVMFIFLKVAKNYYKTNKYADDTFAFYVTAVIVAGLIGIIMMIVNLYTLITCLTFPEKIIYDYVMNLIGTIT